MASTEEVEKVMREWAQETVDRMTADLRSQVKSKSENLAQSIVPELIVSGSEISLQIRIADYYQFVDEGVNGTMQSRGSRFSFKKPRANQKMVKEIEEWITAAGVQLPRGKGDWRKRRNQFAWAIATNRKKFGLQPKPFFKKNIEQTYIDELVSKLSVALGREIVLSLLK